MIEKASRSTLESHPVRSGPNAGPSLGDTIFRVLSDHLSLILETFAPSFYAKDTLDIMRYQK
jgi:hypothetical protein